MGVEVATWPISAQGLAGRTVKPNHTRRALRETTEQTGTTAIDYTLGHGVTQRLLEVLKYIQEADRQDW